MFHQSLPSFPLWSGLCWIGDGTNRICMDFSSWDVNALFLFLQDLWWADPGWCCGRARRPRPACWPPSPRRCCSCTAPAPTTRPRPSSRSLARKPRCTLASPSSCVGMKRPSGRGARRPPFRTHSTPSAAPSGCPRRRHVRSSSPGSWRTTYPRRR